MRRCTLVVTLKPPSGGVVFTRCGPANQRTSQNNDARACGRVLGVATRFLAGPARRAYRSA